jgi:acetolactate synthase-1/2/3 large subunit
MPVLSGAQITMEVLVKEGVEHIFGYPGGAIMPIYDAMLDYDVHHILTRHEQGAAHAADGYARASGKVGVAMATSGPGATNLVTGIATAMLDSSPIVCITGQVPSGVIGTDAFQETDVTGVTLPITKHNYLVTEIEELADTLREAFYVARSGRKGPVLVDIAKDVQNEKIDFRWNDEPVTLPGYRPDMSAGQQTFQEAADLINNAERPIILAGHGVIASGATTELLKFVEHTNTPLSMTLLGLGGFPASHPLNLGMMGMHGAAWVNTAIQEADLLLAFGMRFDDRVTGNLANYAPRAKKIHIEIDPTEIDKNVKVDIAIIGDLREMLEKLLPYTEKGKHEKWLNKIETHKKGSDARDIKYMPDMGHLYAAHVIHDIWRLTNGDALVVTDVGQHQMWETQYYHHDSPRSLITSGGLGTMGFALPAAMGAKLSCPDKEVWVICGDGGFQMTAAELTTLAQEEIDLNVAIINNGYLGMVRQWQEFFYNGRYSATPMLSPDFVKLAEAHHATGIRVSQREDVEPAIQKAQSTPGVVVIDFAVEKEDSVYPMVATGADLDDMIRRPKPEDI